ncbi:uncharacterized protein LOC143246559 isoform X3 [Tachypleus tridentatus]|uniref:uncharacterized protein LOC143246559 isoform X3 n=2 Tax=Tachypleus tridentatus TaxID=6853 RepID=UPI003FD0145A
MSFAPNAVTKKRRKSDSKPQSQLNKCLNEKRRREQENIYIEELAELISARFTDMSSLSVKPDKCAILQETVSQINRIKHQGETNDLQQSEVSSSNSTILSSNILGPLLLEALDGFLLVVSSDGKIVVSENVFSFLKFNKDELIGKSIYSIIHAGDHALVSNILLSISLGNGIGWTSESGFGTGKSHLFNCHFMVKPQEALNKTMEEKQTNLSQYENMQVSTVLLPYPTENIEKPSEESETQNCLFCVARRIPQTEKTVGKLGIEQFTTRLSLTGKVIVVDTSGVSSTYSQYLNKDWIDKNLHDFCHPSDRHKLDLHLKETLQTGSNTSGIYRIKVVQDKYIHIQTKSKKFSHSQATSEEEFIMATHSIIRDGEIPQSVESLQQNSTQTVSGTSPSTSLAANLNELDSVEDISVNTSSSVYGGFPTLSPSSHDFGFNDLGLDIFTTPTWDLVGGSSREDGLVVTTGTASYTPISSPLTQVSSSLNSNNNSVNVHPVVHSSSSAFSSELMTGKMSPVSCSPAAQLTSTNSPTSCGNTPFGTTLSFSPVQPSVSCGSSETTGRSVNVSDPSSSTLQENQSSCRTAQKLRNLLTQTSEKVDSSHTISTSDTSASSDSGLIARTGHSGLIENGTVNSSHSENVILRELLNQEDEEISELSRSPSKTVDSLPLGSSNERFKSEPNGEHQKKTVNNNTMLRKNQNESNQSGGEADSHATNQSGTGDQLFRHLGLDTSSQPGSSSGPPTSLADVIGTVTTKRKSSDSISDSSTETPQKRHHHAHLAGQNPMLVSMLAQTPKTEPSIPTTIASSIMSQLPQDRLPRGLEKKLLSTSAKSNVASTPLAVSTTVSATTQHGGPVFSTSTIRTLLQQDMMTFDSWSQLSLNQHQLSGISFSQERQQPLQQELLLKILNNPDSPQLSRALATSVTTCSRTASSSNSFGQASLPTSTNVTLSGLFGDAVSAEPTGTTAGGDHAPDPLLSQILDEVWSLQQEMESPSVDDSVVVKLLDEVFNQTTVSSATAAQPAMSTQDLQAKMAINAIQRQLMSYEAPGSGATPASSGSQVTNNLTLYPQPITAASPNAMTTFVSSPGLQSSSQPPTYSSVVVVSQRPRLPSSGVVTNGQQVVGVGSVQRAGLPQYPRAGYIPVSLTPQVRSRLYERRQKYLLQQQKRLLAQQHQQQLTLQTQQSINDQLTPSSIPPFPKNMNDLLNNTVAPNVTLQRSTSIPEQLSPRYTADLMGQISGHVGQSVQSQLSPGQRGNQQGPYSPISQPPYPSSTPPANSYQQRLSPHPMPTYPPSGSVPSPSQASGSPRSPHLQAMSPQPGASQPQWAQHPLQSPSMSLQQQNPMLNAQLSQSNYGGQNKFMGQQQRQVHIRSMPSPNSGVNTRNPSFSTQRDTQYIPQPPTNVYQKSQQQQRLQRTISMPGRVNSTCTPQGGGFVGGESLLSPQPQASPSYSSHSLPGTPIPSSVSATNTLVTTSSPSSYSLAGDSSNYFDQQGLQLYNTAAGECRSRVASGGMTSEFVRQELRAKVGARTQQQQQGVNQQQLQYSITGTNQEPGGQTFSSSDLDALGLSLELGESSNGQQGMPGLFSQSLLSISGNQDTTMQMMTVERNSPRVEEPRPPEQKKSLLQQLLSAEPP